MLSMTLIRILFSKSITFTRFIKHEKFGNYEQTLNLVEAGGKACERKKKKKEYGEALEDCKVYSPAQEVSGAP